MRQTEVVKLQGRNITGRKKECECVCVIVCVCRLFMKTGFHAFLLLKSDFFISQQVVREELD